MIEIRELSKSFGNREVLSGLTLDVGRGEIFGLIGPNGAGKTTTIRMLATLLAPTRGDASICGHSILRATREARSKLGYMPDLHGLYEGMTVEDYLRFFAAAYAVPDARLALVVEQILELVDLGPLRGARIGELSRGTQQRISLARVLVHDP
ncbi:MAG: ABC transporter ATP-binding protein [Planctomycetes bacterium]|nr:ABC transporter ATP-binding protein [Planctomycetota bacterium]